MLNKIEITNIRSFEMQEINFSKFNILSGLNSSGKSTLTGLINLLNQTDGDVVNLNGEYSNFGTIESLLYYQKGEYGNDGKVNYSLESGHELHLNFPSDNKDSITIKSPSLPASLNIRYLSSDRLSPNWTFKVESKSINDRNIGVKGENSISYLSQIERTHPLSIPALKHKDLPDDVYGRGLIENINKWIGLIAPGVSLDAKELSELNATKLSFGFSGKNNMTPFSVGYGLTNSLPTILLALTSQPGDILIVENPELNLHPTGQVELGRLLGLVASNGVQVIIETHSDHIINSARLLIKDNVLNNNEVKICHLSLKQKDGALGKRFYTDYEYIGLLENGKIKTAPDDFFDTMEKSLMRLL